MQHRAGNQTNAAAPQVARVLLPAGMLWAILAFPAEAAGQAEMPEDFDRRRLTPVDLLPAGPEIVQHGSAGFSEAESDYRAAVRRHVIEQPYQLQKECAYDFVRLRRKLVQTAAGRPDLPYDPAEDRSRNPGAWVGRPCVLYGRIVGMATAARPGGSNVGELLDLTSDQVLARLDVAEVSGMPAGIPDSGFPVRVVGFLVKVVEQTPYFCAQRVEWLGAIPEAAAFDAVVHKTRGIREEEATAYYETLIHARVLPADVQRKAAAAVLASRIKQRFEEAGLRRADGLARAKQLAASEPGKARELTLATNARFAGEQQQYQKYRQDAATYPVFADVFLNPDVFLGQPVTMRGHVRKVMSYPADVDRFGQTTLHELWLFTDQSQQNPAVIVCSKLPEGFPTSDGEVVDGVSVTGYFFKLYRYAADDANRAAPMLLAQSVTWNPAPSEVAGMSSVGTIATVTILFVCVGLAMYLWSTHEGDRRAREAISMARTADANIPGEDDVPSAVVAGPRESINQSAQAEEAPAVDAVFAAATAKAPAETFQASASRVDLIGQQIQRIHLREDAGDARIDLSGGRTLTMNSDGIDLAASERFGNVTADPNFESLHGATVQDVVLDQWDRAYLILENDLFVTEDFAEDGERCLIFGELESLFAEEPDLTLRDYWTREAF